jgi:endo-1,4-beta-xylanase
MKRNNFLPEVARTAIFGAAIIFFAASSSVLTGCNKANTPEPVANTTEAATGTRLTGFVDADKQLDGTGTSGGFFWSLYFSGGSASITQGSAGNFSSTYSNVSDVVVGKGYNPGSSGTRGYNVGSTSGSYNTIGIYGWTTSPLIEYYVVELGSNTNGTRVNTVSSDGHTYTTYTHQQVSQPSIQGTATFWQYLDNWGGSSKGANHTITMANHINNWKSAGGHGFGSFNYEILSLEAFGGKSGSINATVW